MGLDVIAQALQSISLTGGTGNAHEGANGVVRPLVGTAALPVNLGRGVSLTPHITAVKASGKKPQVVGAGARLGVDFMGDFSLPRGKRDRRPTLVQR